MPAGEEEKMRYKMYELSFPNGVHFGDRSLDEAMLTFSADTLFSALYQEALKAGPEYAEWLYSSAVQGSIRLSDAFPYVDDTYYLPKPLVRPETEDSQGDSVVKKAFKKLKYIPMDLMGDYLAGKLDAQKENIRLKKLARTYLKTSAYVPDDEDTLPYHVGTAYFGEGCGLYIITAAETEEQEGKLYELLDMLSFAGIGGKRTSGLGRFQITKEIEPDPASFEKDGDWVMALNICLPGDDEIESVMDGALYQVKKKGGFVASETFAPENRKKKDLFMFSAGSCFRQRFEGDVFDVADGGTHPVYRYGKPLFWVL